VSASSLTTSPRPTIFDFIPESSTHAFFFKKLKLIIKRKKKKESEEGKKRKKEEKKRKVSFYPLPNNHVNLK